MTVKNMQFLRQQTAFTVIRKQLKNWSVRFFAKNDPKREQLVKERTGLVEGTVTSKRNQYRLEYCESASQLVYQVEREFDLIEKKYNKLIEQKNCLCQACTGTNPLYSAGRLFG